MAIEIQLLPHLKGPLALHVERLLTGKLSDKRDLVFTDDWPDYQILFDGGFFQPEGYDAPTFVLVTVAMKSIDRNYVEEVLPQSIEAGDRRRLVERLCARQQRRSAFDCLPPGRAAGGCELAVQRLDVHLFEPLRRARHGGSR